MHIFGAVVIIAAVFALAALFRTAVVTTSIRDVLDSLKNEEITAEYPTSERPLRHGLGIPNVQLTSVNVSVLYWRSPRTDGTLGETIDVLDQRSYAGLLLTFQDRTLVRAGTGPSAIPSPVDEADEQHAVQILEICSRYANLDDGDPTSA